MEDISTNVVLGVIAGLITTILILVAKTIALEAVMPWLRKASYRGICLEGKWHYKTMGQDTVVEFIQDTNIIKGKATVVTNPDCIRKGIIDPHIDHVRTFDVEGRISNGFVNLVLSHTNKQRLGLHTYLLNVTGDGSKLSGQCSWYAPLANVITSGEVTLYRNEKQALEALLKEQGPVKPEELEELEELEFDEEPSS